MILKLIVKYNLIVMKITILYKNYKQILKLFKVIVISLNYKKILVVKNFLKRHYKNHLLNA